jgi:hypothetical protein
MAITMKVAGVTEPVEVQAEASSLQTETVALGRVIDSGGIQGPASRDSKLYADCLSVPRSLEWR